MARQRKTVAEIEALLLEDVRRQRHCSEVADIVIELCAPDADTHGANWHVVSVDPGGASREFAGAAVMVAMGHLQQEVDAEG